MVRDGVEQGSSGGHEVVISGVAGYFPGSDNVDELTENLANKVDLVSEENCRWNKNNKLGVPNGTGKIRKAAKFDTAHFGIHRKQALSLDPMTCLILERSFEAICDAGISPAEMKGANTGVYMGSTFSEADNLFDYEAGGDGFGIVGHNRSMISTRIAYYLDTKGPAWTALSSWCSGMVALSNAYNDIKAGRCDSAIVGAPNLTLFPVMSWHLAQLGLLSADAKCRSFDEAADGYGRSDAIVVLFLQRASAAKRVYADVLHANVRCFGQGDQSFTKFSQLSLSKHLTNFYQDCGVDPTEIVYLEAHGTANKFADKAELNAVDQVLLRNRNAPLLIGSVKSNLGHTESAAGLVSISKILLGWQRGQIFANLHYTTPAQGIPALHDGRLKVVTETTAWPGGLAAVNTMGIDGNCGHVLLRSHDKKNDLLHDNLARLVTVSGRTEDGVDEMLKQIVSKPYNPEYIRLIQDVHRTNIVGHIYRGLAILEPGNSRHMGVQRFPGEKRPLWFVFSGMGSQWNGMGTHLLQIPVFRQSVEKSHAILKTKGLDLLRIITDEDPTIFDNIMHCFVGIAAMQIALFDVLTALGLKPDGMIGHSVGELGCGYADGCFTAEEMILASYARGRASLETKLIKGTMAAVGLGYNQIKGMLPPEIEVACHNGPGSCTISGPSEELERFVQELSSRGIFARAVNVANIAYHSRHIKPAAPRLLELLKEIIPKPKPRSYRWVSTSVPEDRWDTPLARSSSAEYHTNNLLSSVLFEEGSRHIPRNAITVEIAPHGLLQAILRRSLDASCTNVALTQRGHRDGVEVLLTAIGKLYQLGLQPVVSAIYPDVPFPVSSGTPAISPIIRWEHTEDWPITDVIENEMAPGERNVMLSMSQEEIRAYSGHQVAGQRVFPAAGYLKLVWETLATILEEQFNNLPVVFENVRFHEAATLPEQGSLSLNILVQRGSGSFEVFNISTKKMLVTGKISVPEHIDKEFVSSLGLELKTGTRLSSDDVYSEFLHRGYQYTDLFQGIKSMHVTNKGSVSQIAWTNHWVAYISALLQLSIFQGCEHSQDTQIPLSIQRLVIDPTRHTADETDIQVIFQIDSGVILGGGVQVQGLKTRSFATPNSQVNFTVQSRKFVSHAAPRCKSVKEFFNSTVQIAVENSRRLIAHDADVTVVEMKDAHSLVPHVRQSLAQYPNIKINTSPSNSFLVVTYSQLLRDAVTSLGHEGGFILTRTENKCDLGEDVVLVMEQQFGSGKFQLLKKVKAKSGPYKVVNVTANVSWIQDLRSGLKEQKQVVLISNEEPECGVSRFMEHVLKEHSSHLVRFVFLLDSLPPSDSSLQRQLQQDMVVNIYHEQSWGTFLNQDVGNESVILGNPVDLPLPTLSLEGVELNYLGLNKTDNLDNQMEMSHVDYSGKSDAGHRVMGVTRRGSTKSDAQLTWEVPAEWSVEEAATVPFAYSTAYLALYVTSEMKSNQKVLIHSGCSGIGQAAIAVALEAGCRVFTTVANQLQRDFLIKRFPKLSKSRIYSSTSTRFEMEILKATQKKGVNLILNCLSGNKLLASARALASFGTFIQLGQTDSKQNNALGMLMFLKSTNMYGITPDNIFNARTDVKQRLHDYVKQGIKSGVVKPFQHTVFSYQHYDKAIGMLTDDLQWTKVLVNVSDVHTTSVCIQDPYLPRIQFQADVSILIVGGSTEEWIDMAEWLLERGAKRLVIGQQIDPITNYIARRVNILRANYNASIMLIAIEESINTIIATQLIRQVNNYGPLAAIFVLPFADTPETGSNWTCGDNTSKSSRSLDLSSRTLDLRYFVCLACDEVCVSRRRAGLQSLSIRHTLTLRDVLATFDMLLTATTDPVLVLTPVNQHQHTVSETSSNDVSLLDSLLPGNLQQLVQLGLEVLEKNVMVEVPSLSPGLREAKGVLPVFFLPGLQGLQVLSPLTRRLMYPVICVKLPPGGKTIKEMASNIAKNIRLVQPVGPYNLVGESWGGVLALELARTLEDQGERTQVFLLEAAPETTEESVKQLGEGDSLQTNLISTLLGDTRTELRNELNSLLTWDEKLDHALASAMVTSEQERNLAKIAATTVYGHINALLQHKCQGKQLIGLVTLIRYLGDKEDTCGLTEFCKNTVSVHLVGKDRTTMLTSLETSNIIGEDGIVGT